MIGHGHIDPVWLWRWQEGFQEVKATFRSVLDRMREFPDFHFTGSSAAFYEWVEQNDPAMFEEIRARVAEGRWELVGGWWVEPDCNLPCGESFVRHALYGQRYFQEKFGLRVRVGFNPDSFGHSGMLPQILVQSGFDSYVFMRPGPHEKGLPAGVFWWESQDGSRILTARIPFEYCTDRDDVAVHVRKVETELRPPLTQVLCFFGVGNHRRGPTVRNLQSIETLQAAADGPALRFDRLDRYFDSVRPLRHPVVHDELLNHAPGCYAAHSGVKAWNRQAEWALLTAERLSSLAHRLTGHPFPTDLDRAWKNVLFNQFHDILAGTSLEVAYDDARQFYGESLAIAQRAQNQAVQAISWRIDIPFEEHSKPFVVFNPHGWEAIVPVEVEIGRAKGEDADRVLLDDQGNVVPVQRIAPQAALPFHQRICFVATLPALGYRLYRLVRRPSQPLPFSNDRLRLEVDPDSGAISLFDNGVHLLQGGGQGVVLEDPSDTWSHGVQRFDRVAGLFTPVRIATVESGPVRQVVRVDARFNRSRLVQDFILYRDLPHVEVRVTVDWQEQHRALKLRFPTRLHFPRATFEIPYGSIERPTDGDEVPALAWMDLTGVYRDSGQVYGLSVLNSGKYGCDVLGSCMSLTVLRSPIYAHHDPLVPDPDGDYRYIDQGVQTFSYALVPHPGPAQAAGIPRRAAELNATPVVQAESFHGGPLPPAQGGFACSAANVMLDVVKQAETGRGVVLRCHETDGVETETTLAWGVARWSARFRPGEIRSFHLSGEAEPVAVNLLEDREAIKVHSNGAARP